MTDDRLLRITNVCSIVLVTTHVADDIVLGMSPPGLANLIGIAILAIWLYGTLAIAHVRARLTVMLLGSAFGFVIPVIHMLGSKGLTGGVVAQSPRAFWFAFTALALGITASFGLVLALRGLWATRAGRVQ